MPFKDWELCPELIILYEMNIYFKIHYEVSFVSSSFINTKENVPSYYYGTACLFQSTLSFESYLNNKFELAWHVILPEMGYNILNTFSKILCYISLELKYHAWKQFWKLWHCHLTNQTMFEIVITIAFVSELKAQCRQPDRQLLGSIVS